MLAKYRKTRNRKRRVGRKSRRASKRSRRFFSRKQRGGNLGLTEVSDGAIVYHKDEDDQAPRMMTRAEQIERVREDPRA